MRQGIVIDTNILVNALRKGGVEQAKSRRFLRDVYREKYDVYVSQSIVIEYREVLFRNKLKISAFRRWLWFRWVNRSAYFIEPKPTSQSEVEMGDESDRKFFDVARCAGAKLVTRNYRHYPVDERITLLDELY